MLLETDDQTRLVKLLCARAELEHRAGNRTLAQNILQTAIQTDKQSTSALGSTLTEQIEKTQRFLKS